MRCERYMFHCSFCSHAVLPPFKGSAFRGGFGLALRSVVCALKTQDCSDCILRERCVFSRVFEHGPPADQEGRSSGVHPFLIEPPLSEQTDYAPGDQFRFGLILFGWANDYLPYFVYAFEELGRTGLGRRVAGRRGEFLVQTVSAGGKTIYQSDTRILKPEPACELPLEVLESDVSTKRITIHLETPLRVKHRNRFFAELPFHVLIRSALRRISSLNSLFGSGEPALDYRNLVAKAERVQTVDSSLRWYDVRRYSNRQERAMFIGGMVGSITYEGDLGEFLPLIRYCEKVHVGKATTFGLGKIRVEIPP